MVFPEFPECISNRELKDKTVAEIIAPALKRVDDALAEP